MDYLKKNVIISVVSIITSVIAIIWAIASDVFFTYKSKETMYISGYGSSTKTTNTGSIALSASYPALKVFMIIAGILAIIMAIVILISISKSSITVGPQCVITGLVGGMNIILSTTALFMPLFMGSSNTNGIAGAWKSGSTSFSLAATGWFYVIFAFATGVLLITNAFYYYRDA